MKHLIARTLTTFAGLILMWLPGMAHAQSTIKVNVPFEFAIGDKIAPAGEYFVVEPLQHFLELRDARGYVVASAFTHEVESASVSSKPRLTFYVSGGQHRLAQVWQEGDYSGEQLYGPRHADVMLARDQAGMAGRRESSQP